MKYKAIVILAVLSCSMLLLCQSNSEPIIDLQVNDAEKRVDVMIDGKLFTAYIYPDMIKKPVLWPVMSPAGNMLTRSIPLINSKQILKV